MYYCGIDIGKSSHVASIINSDGDIIKTFPFKNSAEGFNKFLEMSKSISNDIDEVIRINRFTSSAMADDKTMVLKELTRFRTFQAQSIASLKLKAIKVLDVIFMEILLNFPTPDQLIAISTTKLTKFIYSISKGRIDEEKSIYLKEIATKSIGIIVGKSGFIFELQSIINQIKFIESQIKNLDNKVKELYLSFDCFLHTITGIGFTNASIILRMIPS